MEMPVEEVLTRARRLLVRRVERLKNDCRHCLFGAHPAVLPALLECYSSIDLLGSLYGGNATGSTDHARQAETYMSHVMHYSLDPVTIIQGLLRHKILHLGDMQASVKMQGSLLTVLFVNNERGNHLRVEPGMSPEEADFTVSIWSLVEDIEDSVIREGDGYLSLIRWDTPLQEKFNRAYNQMHSPVE